MQTITKSNSRLFYILSLAFLLLELYGFSQRNYLFCIIPVAILIVLFALFALDQLIFIIVFFVPLSVQLKDLITTEKLDMSLPTEPLIFGVMLIFFVKQALDKNFDKKILKHPISIAIYFYLGWMLITSLTSCMPLVSIKFFLSHLWFIVVFYFVGTQLFKNIKNIEKYIWLYAVSLLLVVWYTLFNLSGFGFFNQKIAHAAMRPFFNDHTSYAAIISMFFPILISFVVDKRYIGYKKYVTIIFLTFFIVAILFSYGRASWISILVTFLFWILVILRIRLRTIYIFILMLGSVLFIFKEEIMTKLKENHQDSSANITQHIQSMANVASDASNVERLNRWSCAIRMYTEKPIFGWGPGTYMFKYAPYQRSDEKTIISTNAGDRGNAHSEYIGPLTESGIFGLLSFVALVLVTIYIAVVNVYRKSANPYIRLITVALILGLITYYINGLLNNFLDTDKASALFWGFTAMIVSIDVYHKNNDQGKVAI